MGKKKQKYKKIIVGLLIEVSIPEDLLKSMDKDDRARLYELNRLDIRWKAFGKANFVFHLGDINRVNAVLNKYGHVLVYPERKVINQYGLTYTGNSLNITRDGDNFVIMQRFPDGRIETHIVPEKRVWRVYYTIKRFFDKNPDKKEAKASEIWDIIAREFGIDRFVDRRDKFHPNSFFGDRKTYHTFYYYPIKILQSIGKIRYSKRGIISLVVSDEKGKKTP